MPPSAIAQDTIRLVLLYISQALPLPPHILSKSLLQRHYFLNISPDDYVAYLAWPDSSPELLAEALIGLSSPLDDQDPLYTITYTSDKETALAHVSVASTVPASNSLIRLVFLWDNDDATWKYHNLGLMPFPQDSVPSVDQAMSQISFDQSEMDADSYWGTPDQSDEVCGNDRKPQSDSDDDYWARYSTIQGKQSLQLSSLSPQVSNFEQGPAILRRLHRHGNKTGLPSSLTRNLIESWCLIPSLKPRYTILWSLPPPSYWLVVWPSSLPA